jgi:hypothetical protein
MYAACTYATHDAGACDVVEGPMAMAKIIGQREMKLYCAGKKVDIVERSC